MKKILTIALVCIGMSAMAYDGTEINITCPEGDEYECYTKETGESTLSVKKGKGEATVVIKIQ